MSKVYLDYAATTPTDEDVIRAMTPYFGEFFGNASSQHAFGREAKKTIEDCRESMAKDIGCDPDELYFTSGATESDNWALKGYCFANSHKGRHILISAFEHHAVLNTALFLQKIGYELDLVKVTGEGIIDLEDLRSKIRPDTILISVMAVNNEIGTIQPIAEIAHIAHEHNIAFHSDGAQAVGKLYINCHEQDIDMLSISAHKFAGPKGVGALYIKKGIVLENLLHGGAQERAKRGGTTATPLIVGMAQAMRHAVQYRADHVAATTAIGEYFLTTLFSRLNGVALNGSRYQRVPDIINIRFDGRLNSALLSLMDINGYMASAGAACQAGTVEPSHVLLAMGLDEARASSSIRFSISPEVSVKDVNDLLDFICAKVPRLDKN